MTGEAEFGAPLPRLTLAAEARYEAKRFNDDLNTQPLAAATTVAAQARWRLTDQAEVYLAADNLFSARVETRRDPPRGRLLVPISRAWCGSGSPCGDETRQVRALQRWSRLMAGRTKGFLSLIEATKVIR